jgi:phosphatidylinositol mannoside-binding LppM-like protein
MKRIVLLTAIFAIVLSACRLDVGVEMQLNEDGSGTGTFALSMDDQMRDLIDQSGQGLDPEEFFKLFGIDTSAVKITETRDGDFTTTTASASFESFQELKELFAVGSDLSAIKEATFERTGDEMTLTGLIDMDLAAEIPEDAPVGIETIAQFITISAIVDMPGTVVEHDADRIDEQGRLVWDFTLLEPRRDIMVVATLAEPAARLSNGTYIGAAVGILAGIALGILVFRRRRTKRAT